MTQNQWLLHQLVISCVLSTTVIISQVALAGYEPPDDQKPPKESSDSSGVRVMDG
ncbi:MULTISPECIES: hypothetical protein [unclassified Anabaena]|uniref:hypothetical protein n=1 Tax=unclassified Anabaena TaxID=2619674 RepID=UPI000A8B83AD|nr:MULTISPECIES: hypothetical protein [unclassified Anabaena]